MSSSDRRRGAQEASTSGREGRAYPRSSKDEKWRPKNVGGDESSRDKGDRRKSKSKSPRDDGSPRLQKKPKYSPPDGSSDPDAYQEQRRNRAEVSYSERVDKRIRSEPSLREAGEISEREYAKRQRYDDRSHRSQRHRYDNSRGREGPASRGLPPARRGDTSPQRGSRDDRRTPKGDTGGDQRIGSTPPGRLLAIPAEIRQAALEAQERERARRAAAAAAARDNEGSAEEREDSRGGSAGARSRHTPIVWNGAAGPGDGGTAEGAAPVSTVAHTAAEMAALELERFQRSGLADDFDPDAPPALKASPSVTGSGDGEMKDANLPADEDATGGHLIKSKWLLDDEEDAAPALNGKGVSAAPPVGPGGKDQQDLDIAKELGDTKAADRDWDSDDESVTEFQATRRPVNMLNGCRRVECYERLNRISEGTYGVVYRARDKESGTICALKKIKMEKERDGFPLTSIREINILLSFHHRNIVDVSEVVVGLSLDQVYMVMEFMEHDLKGLMDDMTEPFTVAETKNLMKQLLEGVAYLHDNWVLHRDLKTSNILYNNRGQLKICDFGLARQYGSPLRAYTHNVVTLYYRAIELLLGIKQYSTAIDVWSLGCIMAELLTKKVLFQGTGELDQIDKIFKVVGSPTEEVWPGYRKLPNAEKLKFRFQPKTLRDVLPAASKFDPNSGLTEAGFDLIERMLALDPSKRITAQQALKHRWFQEQPWPKDNALMPTYPTTKDGTARSHRQRISHKASPHNAAETNGLNFAARKKEISSLFAPHVQGTRLA